MKIDIGVPKQLMQFLPSTYGTAASSARLETTTFI